MVCRDFILPKTANYVSFFIPFSICATYSTLSPKEFDPFHPVILHNPCWIYSKHNNKLLTEGQRGVCLWEALTKKMPGKIIKTKIDFWVQFSIGVFYSIHSLKIKHIL